MIDALPDGWAEEHLRACAGWDAAAELAQKVHARRNAPRPERSGGKPMYGMPGHFAPDPADLRARAQQEYPELR